MMKDKGQRIIEDGNGMGMLSASPNLIDVNLFNKAEILSVTIINKLKFEIELTNNLLADNVYGNVIINGQPLRIYINDGVNDYVDAKIVSISENTSSNTVIGCIVHHGDMNAIAPGMEITWGTDINYINKEAYTPTNLHVSFNKNNRVITWDDPTPHKSMAYFKLHTRLHGSTSTHETTVGGWVFGVDIELEANRLPEAKSVYNNRNVYWMEFSEPEMIYGTKSKGWIEVIDGNYGDVFMIDKGGGYKDVPSIMLYYKDPSDNVLINPDITRNGNIIKISDPNNIFEVGDDVELISSNNINIEGIYNVIAKDMANNTFDLLLGNNELPDGVTTNIGCTVKLAPIKLPENHGRLRPIFHKNKYILSEEEENMISGNKTVDIKVMGFYTDDGKEYSDYSNSFTFKT